MTPRFVTMVINKFSHGQILIDGASYGIKFGMKCLHNKGTHYLVTMQHYTVHSPSWAQFAAKRKENVDAGIQ